MVGSFELHLMAERKSPKTVRTYTEAAQWFAAAALLPAGVTGCAQVTTAHVQRWIASLAARYSGAYAVVPNTRLRPVAVLRCAWAGRGSSVP